MSEPSTALPEDAPRAAVIRQLRIWSHTRQQRAGDPPAGLLESCVRAASDDGGAGAWDGLCETIHACGLHLELLATAPGLWSHCRLAAGPAWNGIATMTRGLIRHLGGGRSGIFALGRAVGEPGVGCVAIDGEQLWLADHLLYACQEDLEIGDDCRFYGCARDPDLHGLIEHRNRWSFAQRRWFTVMAGLESGQLPVAGWISSPRWLFPLPAHALPRRALASPLGQRLWNAALAAADGCAACVSPQPCPWWSDRRLVPEPRWAGRWAGQRAVRERRGGCGVLTLDDLASRRCDDPCLVPMVLAAIAPGAERCADRVWTLFVCLERQLRGLLDPAPSACSTAPQSIVCALASGGHRLLLERDGDRHCVNGWAVSRALGMAGLMPAFGHLQGLVDWPPSTLLRSGMAAVLSAHAAAVLHPGTSRRAHGASLDIGELSWSWEVPGVPTVPCGLTPIGSDQLAQAVAHPGWAEIEGGTAYEAVTSG